MSHRLLIRRLSPWALALHLLLASLAVPASPSPATPEEPQTAEAWNQTELPDADPSSSVEASSWPARASEWLSGAGPWAVPVAWAGAALLAAALALQVRHGRKTRNLARTRAAVHSAALTRAAEWRGTETRRAPDAPRSRPPDRPASPPQPKRTNAAQPRPAVPSQQPARRAPMDHIVERTAPVKQATTRNAASSRDVARAPSAVGRTEAVAVRVFAAKGPTLDEALILAWNAILSSSQESSTHSRSRAREGRKVPSVEAPPALAREPLATTGTVWRAEPSRPEAKDDEVTTPAIPRPQEPRPTASETPPTPPVHAEAPPTPTPAPLARGEDPADPRAGAVPDDAEAASLLLDLAQREAALGHMDEALESAREAHRALHNRASLIHLIRLLTVARRFEPQDRERLRRAVRRQPDAPVLLHAAGVSESLHGDPWAARGLLLEALRLERREEIREEIRGILTSLDAPQRRTHAPASPDRPGRNASIPDDLAQDAPVPTTH